MTTDVIIQGSLVQLCADHYEQADSSALTSTDERELVHHNQQGLTACIVPGCKKTVAYRVTPAVPRLFKVETKNETESKPHNPEPVSVSDDSTGFEGVGGEANP